MPTLIDGHNLIAKIPSLSLSDSEDEAALVMLLRRYATGKRGRKVIVVFDHGVYGHPDTLNGYGVECHFAKSPRDADHELIRRIRRIRRAAEWQVVTSDRAVAGEARAHKIRVISSEAFARKLQQQEQPAPHVSQKYRDRPLSEREVEDWLREFGIADEPAPEDD